MSYRSSSRYVFFLDTRNIICHILDAAYIVLYNIFLEMYKNSETMCRILDHHEQSHQALNSKCKKVNLGRYNFTSIMMINSNDSLLFIAQPVQNCFPCLFSLVFPVRDSLTTSEILTRSEIMATWENRFGDISGDFQYLYHLW